MSWDKTIIYKGEFKSEYMNKQLKILIDQLKK